MSEHVHEWFKLTGWRRYACRHCDERRDQLPEDTCPAINHDRRQCLLAKGHEGNHYEPGCNFGWS